MRRVIIHWTAGTHVANTLDRKDYHYIIEGSGKIVPGIYSISDNESTADGKYAAHTYHCNTGSIGISLAGMAGAIQGKTNGKYPLNEVQFNVLAELVAKLIKQYQIPLTDKTVLTHAEVQPNLGITQKGKWDIAVIPFKPELKGPKACGDYIRNLIKEKM